MWSSNNLMKTDSANHLGSQHTRNCSMRRASYAHKAVDDVLDNNPHEMLKGLLIYTYKAFRKKAPTAYSVPSQPQSHAMRQAAQSLIEGYGHPLRISWAICLRAFHGLCWPCRSNSKAEPIPQQFWVTISSIGVAW